ncbi:MAG: hypothetical protein A2X48_18670 [Lentisphaerae bacterium GWF2_49_21]|nr:MAG: hypothetical protein A2X48_18670 [Lentisphaerae bacterium GWF2_49_21]
MLIGLVLVSMPVVIHLLNRNKARPVKWGAMRFLAASLETERRRLLLEEMILLVLRCLLVAAIVMAMARPFLSSQPSVSWLVTLPLLAIASICIGVSSVVWKSVKTRKRLLLVAGLSAIFAIAAAASERWLQKRSWLSASGDRDIIIIIDGSDSMRILADGRPNFNRAKDEAIQIVKNCSSGDSVGLILAGPIPYALVKAPTSNHREIIDMINHRDFQPAGGSFGALEAFNAAAAMLVEGRNPVKKIVLFTDKQAVGWDIQSQARWNYLAGNLNTSAIRPKVVVRRFTFPQPFRNAAIADITFPRACPGIGQPVKIEVKVVNGGDLPIQPAAVRLLINGETITRETFLKELPPGASETVTFEHRFKKAGRAVVTCEIACNDDQEVDNTQTRIIDVIDTLPVLIIDGAPSKRPIDGAAEFMRLALCPGNVNSPENKAGLAFPIKPEVVGVDVAMKMDLDKFRVIILANPPFIPQQLGEKLIARVRSGGGLFIAPGDRTDPKMLNSFRSQSGERFLPAEIIARKNLPDSPAHFALKSFTHPALRLCAETTRSDASLALINSYWRFNIDKADVSVDVCGLLDTGDPFMAERKFGHGFVAMTSFAMDRNDSTLPSLKIFVPAMHEIVYHLSSAGGVDANIKAGTEVIFELNDGSSPSAVSTKTSARADVSGKVQELPVMAPIGRPGKAELLKVDGRRLVRCSDTRWPGLYRIMVASIKDSPKGADGQPLTEMPFVVLANPEESSLGKLSEEELMTLRDRIDLFSPKNIEELMTATTGGVPGREIWKYLMALALVILVAEVVLERWIASNRRIHLVEAVEFHGQTNHSPESYNFKS